MSIFMFWCFEFSEVSYRLKYRGKKTGKNSNFVFKMSPATEVDLTSETPPRKMKQALLPFGQSANRQNASPKTNAGIDRNNDILKH